MTSDTPNTGDDEQSSHTEEDSNIDEPEGFEEHDSVEASSAVDAGDSREEPEEAVPELDEDVYRKPFGGHDTSDPAEIASAVEEMSPEAASKIRELFRMNEKLNSQVTNLREKVTETNQELKEFKRRKNDETEEIKETATKDFVRDAVPIRDDLDRALDQENGDIRSGVKLIKEDFDELLVNEGVTIIEPEPGDEVDPEIHEVMTQVESEFEEGLIDECFRPGYSMEGYIIRPARVTVSGTAD